MPKPIPPELLKQYERAFHEIRETYRHGVEINLPPEGAKVVDSGAPREGLERGPCVVCDRINTFALKSDLEKSDSAYEYDECFKPIPEIAAILAYLEELP